MEYTFGTVASGTMEEVEGFEFKDVDFREESFNTTKAAIGIKAKAGKVLLNFNLLINLSDNGLTDDLHPCQALADVLDVLERRTC